MSYKYHEKGLSLYAFPIYIFLSILIGATIGSLLDKLIIQMQNGSTSKSACAFFLFLQLIIMSFFIYVFVFGYFNNIIHGDNFATGSFFFNLAFFTLQPSIASNLQILLDSKSPAAA